MKVVKRRINSVTTTKKIMKAMNMVAASKLQKDKARLEAARPFLNGAQEAVNALIGCPEADGNEFVAGRKNNGIKTAVSSGNGHTAGREIVVRPGLKSAAYLVITGDRGLCGAYNTNVIKKALEFIEVGENPKIIVIGLKGFDYFIRHGKKVFHKFDNVLETAFYDDAERIGNYLLSLYSSGEIDEAYMAFTRFESALSHIPGVERLLPLRDDFESININKNDNMKYDPDIGSYLGHAIPFYINAFIYAALLESSACEQAARMVSMDTAVSNASDIKDKLTRVYNRRRQAAITQEISELVSSANANGQ